MIYPSLPVPFLKPARSTIVAEVLTAVTTVGVKNVKTEIKLRGNRMGAYEIETGQTERP